MRHRTEAYDKEGCSIDFVYDGEDKNYQISIRQRTRGGKLLASTELHLWNLQPKEFKSIVNSMVSLIKMVEESET